MTVRELRQMLFDLPGHLPVLVIEQDNAGGIENWFCPAKASVETVMDMAGKPEFAGATYALRKTDKYAVVIQ